MNTNDLEYFDRKFEKVEKHVTAEVQNHEKNCKKTEVHCIAKHGGLTLWGTIGAILIFTGGITAIVIAIVEIINNGR